MGAAATGGILPGLATTPRRTHLLARAPLADRMIVWLEQAWARGWCDEPTLDPEALWSKAARGFDLRDEASGRSPHEVADFRERLERLTASIRGEADLNALGRTIAHGQLVRVIRQRLALGRLWRQRPEVLETPLAPPILVVGQMRSGTTRLHRMLAADRRFSATRFCDSWLPVPSRPDWRRAQAGASLLLARAVNPWLDTLHPFGAGRADEELGWLASALDHCAYEAQWRIPSYTAWSEERGADSVYAEFARLLATDAAHHGKAARPRVMKVPQFAEDLAVLLKTFPSARVVVSHRASGEVAHSALSLVANQMALQSDSVDLAWLRNECARKIALREQRMRAGLANFDGRVAVAQFAHLQEDWRGAIAGVYCALGLEITREAWRALEREQAAAARQPHRQHQEQLRQIAEAA